MNCCCAPHVRGPRHTVWSHVRSSCWTAPTAVWVRPPAVPVSAPRRCRNGCAGSPRPGSTGCGTRPGRGVRRRALPTSNASCGMPWSLRHPGRRAGRPARSRNTPDSVRPPSAGCGAASIRSPNPTAGSCPTHRRWCWSMSMSMTAVVPSAFTASTGRRRRPLRARRARVWWMRSRPSRARRCCGGHTMAIQPRMIPGPGVGRREPSPCCGGRHPGCRRHRR